MTTMEEHWRLLEKCLNEPLPNPVDIAWRDLAGAYHVTGPYYTHGQWQSGLMVALSKERQSGVITERHPSKLRSEEPVSQ